MHPLIIGIITGISVAVFSSLLTFFVTSISKDTLVKSKINNAVQIHKQIDHQKSIFDVVEHHENTCTPRSDLPDIKKTLLKLEIAVAFLIKQAGGDPKDYKLNDQI